MNIKYLKKQELYNLFIYLYNYPLQSNKYLKLNLIYDFYYYVDLLNKNLSIENQLKIKNKLIELNKEWIKIEDE